MRTPQQVRELAAGRCRREFRRWLADEQAAADENWSVPLHPPTEQEAMAAPDRVAGWVQAWGRVRAPGVEVTWQRRRWSSMGSQQVPVRVTATGAAAVAGLAGREAEWERLAAWAQRLRSAYPDAPYLGEGMQAGARRLAALDEADLDTLRNVLDWLTAHPHNQLQIRELPIPGVDTKWVERHRHVVGTLVGALTGSVGLDVVGEAQRFRVRVLDASLRVEGTPADLTASVAELDRWRLEPLRVLVVENLASLASLPPLAGTAAVHGRGYAVTQLAEVSWVRGAPELLYWGDVDSHGFAILARCREVLPQTRSVLMGRSVLQRYSELVVPELVPYRAEVAGLTADERETLALLRENDVRLEQERISPADARRVLEGVVSPGGGSASGW